MNTKIPSILAQILVVKKAEVMAAQHTTSPAILARLCSQVRTPRGLREHLRRAPGQPVRLIAEIKRASPSAGSIREDANPSDIGMAYQRAGAAAISVLTDNQFFDGSLTFLPRVRSVVEIPILRKDFVIDPYQVLEARAGGADGVLLIVAALDDGQLRELMAAVEEVSMDALVEVHNVDEAERALSAGATLLGVNHRNLVDFTMDMSLTGKLAGLVPEHVVLVGESGVRSADDVLTLGRAGAHAVLVGESLMRAPSPEQAARALVGIVPERAPTDSIVEEK